MVTDIYTILISIFYYYFLYKYRNYFCQSLSRIFELLISHLFLFLYCYTLFIFSHGHILLAVIYLTELITLQIKLWQLKTQVECFRKKRFKFLTITHILTVYKQIIVFILKNGPTIGNVFFMYIIVNIPFNGYFTMHIATGKGNNVLKIFEIVYILQQMCGLFIFHFILAKNNEKLIKISYQIMQIPFHNRISIQTRIRLNLFIENSYTKNIIGIRYGIFGTITFLALFKVSCFSL